MSEFAITFRPIGVIRSEHVHAEATPIQPGFAAFRDPAAEEQELELRHHRPLAAQQQVDPPSGSDPQALRHVRHIPEPAQFRGATVRALALLEEANRDATRVRFGHDTRVRDTGARQAREHACLRRSIALRRQRHPEWRRW